MSFNNIYDIGGSALNAQVMRMDTIASNLANADTASDSSEGAYRAIKPVFSAMYQQAQEGDAAMSASVEMLGVVESDRPVEQRYEPNNPLANADGYVFYSNVNTLSEMADMMSATRSYQTSIEVLSRVNSMQQGILKLGQ